MILVRPVLIVVCVTFAILMNSCFGYYDECGTGSAYCEDSTVATFNITPEASSWWINDSVNIGYVEFKNELGATLSLYKTKVNTRIMSTPFDTYKYDRQNNCKDLIDCDIRFRFMGYSFDYFQSEYNFKISIKLDRAIPTNTNNLDSSLWTEHLVFTNRSKTIKLIPNQPNPAYSTFETIPSININNKTYTNAIHVYDSSLMNLNTLEIVGYYYTPTDGLIRYYLNNNDVWSIQ